jgi:plastocyanin
MADTSIDINEVPGQALAAFSPEEVTVNTGDYVFWRNNASIQHWPTKKGEADNYWMNAPLAGKLPGGDADTSGTISFEDAMTVTYVCALHRDEEGTITVT